MGIIRNYLFAHNKKYQRTHLLYQRCGGWSTGYFTDSNLELIPYKDRTKELCILAYTNVLKDIRDSVLRQIPNEHFLDKDFRKKLMEIDSYSYNYFLKQQKESNHIIKGEINVY